MTRSKLALIGLAALTSAACGSVHAAVAPTPTVTASGGPTLTGKEVSITSFRGHPVVLIFWGSWCGPCHDEQPQLNQAYATWSPRGVDFLGIDLRDENKAALAFQSQLKVPYPSIADSNATIAINYRIPSAPALVFLDNDGKVADTVLGALGVMTLAQFNTEITTLLGTPSTSA
jgi:thiol-disulfide isomerase/thioredoxin